MIFLLVALCLPARSYAQDVLTAPSPAAVVSTDAVLPTYVALEPDINGFNLFADGGPDANWYVGFNNAWIVKLPPAPAGHFSRAFIGAKLGRAKTSADPDAPWRRDIVDGKIYIAVSQTPAFSPEQSFFLVQTEDIPREPDAQSNVAGAGASRWFWAEAPLEDISASSDNYLAVWSPSPALTSSSNAPILAADNDSADAAALCSGSCAWNNNTITGAPPRQADGALETPLNNLLPAIAIELVPAMSASPRKISVSDPVVAPQASGVLIRFSASGRDVSRAWVEISQDGLDWRRIGPFLNEPPFMIALNSADAPRSGEFLRAVAQDIYGDRGESSPYAVP